MRFVKLGLFTFVVLIAVVPVFAGKFNKTLSPGSAAPEWKELPGIDGNRHSSSDLKDKEVVVVVFTCNSCDYAVGYEDRLVELSKTLAANKKCALVAICPNPAKIQGDSLEELAAKAKEKGFEFPYLQDESQAVSKAFGAIRTPEFFVLNKERKVVYMGSLDDSPEGTNITKTYVSDAVTAALAGKKPAVEETAPVGCLIRTVRVRKTEK